MSMFRLLPFSWSTSLVSPVLRDPCKRLHPDAASACYLELYTPFESRD